MSQSSLRVILRNRTETCTDKPSSYMVATNSYFFSELWVLIIVCCIIHMPNENTWMDRQSMSHDMVINHPGCMCHAFRVLTLNLLMCLKLKEGLHCTCLHHSLQLFSFSLWSALFEVPQEWPLPRTIITLACDPHWVARQRDEIHKLDCGHWSIILCSTPHSFM